MKTTPTTTLTTILCIGLSAAPALAHPGHGMPGWLHHGEPLLVAAAVTAVYLLCGVGALGRAWRSRRRRPERRPGPDAS